MGLSTVFNDLETVPVSNFQNRRHVSRLPIKMHRDDYSSSGRNCGLQLGWIKRKKIRLNIYQYGHRSSQLNCCHRRHGGMGNRNHLIALPNAARRQRQMQGFGAAAYADSMRCANK